MRRPILLILPALALILWGVLAQLPRWTAPYANWFAASTPGVCAAVDSLRLYGGQRSGAEHGTGATAAENGAAQAVTEHYDSPAQSMSEALAVEATLPGTERADYYLLTATVTDAVSVIYIHAESGEVGTLITAPNDTLVTCAFDSRAALVAAVRSPAALLLGGYVALTAGGLVARRLWQANRKHG